jgi:hypothetical protein
MNVILRTICHTAVAFLCITPLELFAANHVTSSLNAAFREAASKELSIAEFLQLPPAERIGYWKNHEEIGVITPLHDALVVVGTDTVPYLISLARGNSKHWRIEAVKLLCDMDRYVSSMDTPLAEAGGRVVVSPIHEEGYVNPFILVDGRRIGADGHAVVKWAAEQTKDRDLRIYAREYAGLLQKDLEQLPLAQQVSLWQDSSRKSTGGHNTNAVEPYYTFHELSKLFTSEGKSVLPLLSDLLKQEKDEWVRESIISELENIDQYGVRLRATEEGRKAIEAVRAVLAKSNVKPGRHTREDREARWNEFSAVVLKDRWEINGNSLAYIIGLAFEAFYDEKTIQREPGDTRGPLAKPIIIDFIKFLTSVDPTFPRWEYSYSGFFQNVQVVHPKFKAKMARYHEQWKKFQQVRSGSFLRSPSQK